MLHDIHLQWHKLKSIDICQSAVVTGRTSVIYACCLVHKSRMWRTRPPLSCLQSTDGSRGGCRKGRKCKWERNSAPWTQECVLSARSTEHSTCCSAALWELAVRLLQHCKIISRFLLFLFASDPKLYNWFLLSLRWRCWVTEDTFGPLTLWLIFFRFNLSNVIFHVFSFSAHLVELFNLFSRMWVWVREYVCLVRVRKYLCGLGFGVG